MQHSMQFQKLTALAENYLGVPQTSSDSERQFRAARNIVAPARCSFDSFRVKMLTFQKLNQ